MSLGTSSEQRETYRELLYRDYLATHSGDLGEARRSLHGAGPYLRRLIRKFLPQDRNIRILELGCGYGALLYWLTQAGYRCLEGIDRSPEQVEGAHQLGLDFVRQDDLMAHLAKRASASCDVVIAFDVLEHFAKEEALLFSDRVFRALAPGGIFIIHLPNGEGIFSGAVVYGDFTHEVTLTRKSLGQMLRCSGFSQVNTYEDTPVVHGMVSAGRYLMWKAFRTLLRVGYAAETGDIDPGLILTRNLLAVARKGLPGGQR